MNRLVKKFGKWVEGDNLTDDYINKYFMEFIQELRDKGYIPVKNPILSENYHKYNKGEIIYYEDVGAKEVLVDKHSFWMRCVYVGKRKSQDGYLNIVVDKLAMVKK